MYLELLDKHPIISDQISRPALGVVLAELESQLTNKTAGDIVELGCYVGTTSLFIRRLLDHQPKQTKKFYAYDSFEGLPMKTAQDQSAVGVAFQAGELQTSKKQFLRGFQKAGLRPPVTHKAWFHELTADQLPKSIAFGFLDGDFYQSILDSLQIVWPLLSSGGSIAIDDYDRQSLPGVKHAVDTFFNQIPIRLHVEHQIAVIHRTR